MAISSIHQGLVDPVRGRGHATPYRLSVYSIIQTWKQDTKFSAAYSKCTESLRTVYKVVSVFLCSSTSEKA